MISVCNSRSDTIGIAKTIGICTKPGYNSHVINHDRTRAVHKARRCVGMELMSRPVVSRGGHGNDSETLEADCYRPRNASAGPSPGYEHIRAAEAMFTKVLSLPTLTNTPFTMPFTITAPAPLLPIQYDDTSDSDPADSDGDVDMERPAKRPKLSTKSIVTPGETVTDDPQWMRYKPHDRKLHIMANTKRTEATEHTSLQPPPP